MAEKNSEKMENIIALCKRRGFVFQASDIYGGLAGTWDLGPHGAALAHNIKELWWKHFVLSKENMFGLSTSILMPTPVWRASGHLEGFADPVIECEKCHHRFRADQLSDKNKCPDCEGKLGEEKSFNLMFPVSVGSGDGNDAYLRGEIAQGMFVHFKNVIDTMHPTLPFGLAQIGKAFRNEIAPRDFLFRVREFDLMEFEYFVRENFWEEAFEYWRTEMWKWIDMVGINKNEVTELEVEAEDRAHYSKRTIDFEFEYPFGKKELYGLAYRTDHDLKAHSKESGIDLTYLDPITNEKFTPHVVEPTFGLGRTMLAVLLSAYTEDELGGEKRIYLKFNKEIAPIRVAVFPLLKNKPELVGKAREVYMMLKRDFPNAAFDDNGNIGKRYRRQDEIGTPFCITIDFDTLENDTVTVRDRDTGEQKRVNISDLKEELS
ncbi:MAG: glycine--tRNA ligase [bacterium]|nr:glycine--tRNA ligase [bacterium]